MKQSARVPLRLSESLHRHLNAYALAASAAGVGVLALVQPADAKIIYTPAHVKIRVRRGVFLDLNHDGIHDFEVSNTSSGYAGHAEQDGGLRVSPVNRKNLMWGRKRDASSQFGPWASALSSGVKIEASPRFKKSHSFLLKWSSHGTGTCCYSRGPWKNVQNRYLGLRFVIKGQIHYGWARLNVTIADKNLEATLTGYAYETIPNKPIIAGQTHGTNKPTLGRLAQGASGVVSQIEQ
jgi:hypothetical protein